jgi:hypothetical protein
MMFGLVVSERTNENEQALMVTQIMDAIYKSSDEGKEVAIVQPL